MNSSESGEENFLFDLSNTFPTDFTFENCWRQRVILDL